MSEDLEINRLLVDLFDDIVELERKVLITDEFKDISSNDMHIINAIGKKEPKNMSTLAGSLRVTVGTLTIAINNLVKKGYVNRFRSQEDKRVVLVSLSDKGENAYKHHEDFHKGFVEYVTKGLDMAQKSQLIGMLQKIHGFIDEFKTKK